MGDNVKPRLIEKLKKLAAEECWSDNPDFVAEDYAGGNFDDAYTGGEHSGRVELAREILREITHE